MRAWIIIVCCLLAPVRVPAACLAGLALDSSTNMLMRPDGQSGSLVSLYGGVSRDIGNISCSYGLDTGFIQHYDGLQYQRHTVDAVIPLTQSRDGFAAVAVEGTFARYGDVTILDGFDEYGIATTGKQYLNEATLFRWEGGLTRRRYPQSGTEDYLGAESFLRLDRFFNSGLTLRGQFDIGWRYRDGLDGTPTTTLAGFRFRVAKSLGTRWGIWAEGMVTGISAAQSVEDTTAFYDRIFLDDPYSYSKQGLVVNAKRLLPVSGFLEFRAGVQKRRYDDSLGDAYWYLPASGWEETETSLTATVSWRPSWIPALVMPSLDVYYRDIQASNEVLSYRAAGLTLRFEYY